MGERTTCTPITEYLYVGGVEATIPDECLFGVGLGEDRSGERRWVRYVYVPLEDRDDEADFSSAIPIILSIIDAAREAKSVAYVHCTHGMSRSPSACVAYLVLRVGMSFSDARDLVCSLRKYSLVRPGYQRAILSTSPM